jgi:hypothetical protein
MLASLSQQQGDHPMNTFIAVIVTVLISSPALSFDGEGGDAGGNTAQGSSVHSGKSNADNRAGGTGGSAAEDATINNTKSNTYRTGPTPAQGKANDLYLKPGTR